MDSSPGLEIACQATGEVQQPRFSDSAIWLFRTKGQGQGSGFGPTQGSWQASICWNEFVLLPLLIIEAGDCFVFVRGLKQMEAGKAV